MKPINPHFLMAKRRAERDAARFGHPYLDYPAIARQGRPAHHDLNEAPIIPEPANLPEIPGWNWDTAILAVCFAIMVSLLFIEV